MRAERLPAACTTRAQTRPAWMNRRIAPVPRSEAACFTVTSESGSTVTVVPFRNVIRAMLCAPVLIRSPSARFMPLAPGSPALAPAGIRSTGGARTLRVAATSD